MRIVNTFNSNMGGTRDVFATPEAAASDLLEAIAYACGNSDGFPSSYYVDIDGRKLWRMQIDVTPVLMGEGLNEHGYDGDEWGVVPDSFWSDIADEFGVGTNECGEKLTVWGYERLCTQPYGSPHDHSRPFAELMETTRAVPSSEPIVVVVRRPDEDDEIVPFGESVRTIYLDLGRSFDVSRPDPHDASTVTEWLSGHRADIADLPADSPARLYVEGVLSAVSDAFGVEVRHVALPCTHSFVALTPSAHTVERCSSCGKSWKLDVSAGGSYAFREVEA